MGNPDKGNAAPAPASVAVVTDPVKPAAPPPTPWWLFWGDRIATAVSILGSLVSAGAGYSWFRHRRTGSSGPAAMTPAVSSRKIFISYRREDSADVTGRLYDRLVQKFGREVVFKDVDSKPLGMDFRRHLQSEVSECSVLLARDWLTAKSGNQAAIARDIPVISVPDPDFHGDVDRLIKRIELITGRAAWRHSAG